ncbi:MAG: hypothetical protein GX061_00375 [Eubacteriaceae bacterium]|nr:hypothetical protein [Eubacteriaceae bacterium]
MALRKQTRTLDFGQKGYSLYNIGFKISPVKVVPINDQVIRMVAQGQNKTVGASKQ